MFRSHEQPIRRVMLQQVGKVWYDKKQQRTTTVFGKNAVVWWGKCIFVERHIFRGYLVSIEDIISDSMSMTKDLIQKIHDESNSWDECCQKLGEIFWGRYDGLKPFLPVTVNSQLKTETGQLTSPTVSQVHGYPGYCPRLPPMSDQCYGTQQISLVQTHTSSDRQDMAHPTAIESDPSRNARPNHTGTNKDGSSDQCDGM